MYELLDQACAIINSVESKIILEEQNGYDINKLQLYYAIMHSMETVVHYIKGIITLHNLPIHKEE